MQRHAFTKFIILSVFLAPGVITSSYAAPFNSYCNCSGWYLGEYIGNALGHSKFNTSVGTLTSSSYFSSQANIDSVTENGSRTLHPIDFKGQTVWGIQTGYNWATQNFIYGLATDFGFFNLNGLHEVTKPYPTFTAAYHIETEIKTNWLWTARARFGVRLFPCWPFIYGTGGVALTRIEVSNAFSDTAPSLGNGISTHESQQLGWVVGGGIELPLCKNFSVNGEYLFTKFDPTSTNTTINGTGIFSNLVSPFETKADLSTNIIRVGINYKF